MNRKQGKNTKIGLYYFVHDSKTVFVFVLAFLVIDYSFDDKQKKKYKKI